MLSVKRSSENPVLLPDRDQSWESEATFNGCAVQEEGQTHLLYRAESSPQLCVDVTIKVSSIGHAVSRDGVHFFKRRQLIKPEYEWEKYGCEDPRVVKFGDKFYIFYTALSQYPFSSEGIKIGVAITKDFKKIIEKHLVTPFNAKAMTLFPKKVNGKMAALLTAHTDQPPSSIGLAYFNSPADLWSEKYWDNWQNKLEENKVLLQREKNDHIMVGVAPIWTPKGWVFIYSHILDYISNQQVSTVQVALLDLKDPRKVIGHTERPLLTPDENYEQFGRVPNVVFPAGAVVLKGSVYLYYGAADTTCCLAVFKLKDLLHYLLSSHIEPAVRFAGNPIITPNNDHAWEAKATFNPAVLDLGGIVHILYRAQSNDNTSTIGYAQTEDGFNITKRLPEPIYTPRESFEQKLVPGGNSGCEDPRLTLLDNIVYMCYTAFDGKNSPRVALTSLSRKDFEAQKWSWSKPRLISPPGIDDKDTALFPKKIGGKYVFLHRLGTSIWIDFVDNLNFDKKTWLKGQVLINPRQGFNDSQKIGIAGPPIETKDGWLLLYHGISKKADHHYHLRAALLDLKNPTIVLARTRDPILEPEAEYEKNGQVPHVVFSCGSVVRKKDDLLVYYGGADSVTAVAKIPLAVLLKHLREESSTYN